MKNNLAGQKVPVIIVALTLVVGLSLMWLLLESSPSAPPATAVIANHWGTTTPDTSGASPTGINSSGHLPFTLKGLDSSVAEPQTAPAAGPSYAKPQSYGCPSGPCPKSLDYAVEGCICAGQIYESSEIDAYYCCAEGFSYEECAESLAEEAQLESVFGSTEDEILAELVEVEIQGWPVMVNEAMADAIERVNENLASVDYAIVEPITCWNWRTVPGNEVMSRHAFAIALDINPATNPSCGANAICECYNDLITDMPADFIDAFEREGFEWGGNWEDHPDPMHFEWTGWPDLAKSRLDAEPTQ